MFDMVLDFLSPILDHDLPASSERYTTSPCEVMTGRISDSPIPAYTTLGSDSETTTAPTEPI